MESNLVPRWGPGLQPGDSTTPSLLQSPCEEAGEPATSKTLLSCKRSTVKQK